MKNPLMPKLSHEDLKILGKCKTTTLVDGETLNLSQTHEAVIVLEGEMFIMKNEEAFLSVRPGYVLGLKQILTGDSCKLKLRAKNARMLCLKKEDLLDPKLDFLKVFRKFSLPLRA